MWNAQTYKQEFLRLLVGQFSTVSSDFRTDASIFQAINEAMDRLMGKYNLRAKRDSSVSLVSGTGSYAVPRGILGRRIQGVSVSTSAGGTERSAIQELSYADFTERFNIDDTTDTGGPTYWTYDAATLGNILVRPIPNYAGTLYLTFTPRVTPLFRILNVAARTATVAYNGTTVTCSTLTTGEVLAGDEFGIITSLQTDNAAVGDTTNPEPPLRWYPISAVTIASPTFTLTLGESFGQASQTTKPFIAAQVPDIEKAYPGRFGFIPVWMALEDHFRVRDSEKAALLAAMISRRESEFTLDQANQAVVGYDPGNWSNFLS